MIQESLAAEDWNGPKTSVEARICRIFSEHCQRGERPLIDDALDVVDADSRPSLFRKLLEIEVLHETSFGNASSADDYISKYPSYSSIVQNLFDTRVGETATDSLLLPPTQDSRNQPALNDKPLVWSSGNFVDRYRLTQILGRGSFGEVWKAYDGDLDIHVAIKLPRKQSLVALCAQQFVSEARKCAALKQSEFVAVLNVGTDRGFPFVVSELIEGKNLQELCRVRKFGYAESANIVAQIARALHKAHLAGLVHRDIKPSNVMLRRDETIVITDFGLATSEQEQLREDSVVVGTYNYMAPEQAHGGNNHVDGRSDIYSLGIMLFELLTGQLPYLAETHCELLEQLAQREIRSPRSLDDTIPEELERICLKCVAKSMDDRYANAADLAEDLDQWRQSLLETPEVPQTQIQIETQNSRIPQSRRLLSTMASIICLAAIVIYFRGSTAEQASQATASPLVQQVRQETNGWQPLLNHKHSVMAWSPRGEADNITFDDSAQMLSASCPKGTWLTQSQIKSSGPFRARMIADVSNWIGQVGVLWAIRLNENELPKKQYHCFGVIVNRSTDQSPPIASIYEYVIQLSPDGRARLTMPRCLAEAEVSIPASPSVLEFDISAQGFRVTVDGQERWLPDISDDVLGMMLSTEGGIGLIGRGQFVTIKQPEIRCDNQ